MTLAVLALFLLIDPNVKHLIPNTPSLPKGYTIAGIILGVASVSLQFDITETENRGAHEHVTTNKLKNKWRCALILFICIYTYYESIMQSNTPPTKKNVMIDALALVPLIKNILNGTRNNDGPTSTGA